MYVSLLMGDRRRKCVETHCKKCEQPFYAVVSRLGINGQGKFCSRACQRSHQAMENAHASKSPLSLAERRSKIDKKVFVAHRAVSKAVEKGTLLRRPCEKCGAEKVDAHHDDYTKPLAVRWLCRKHHLEHHRKTGHRYT